MATLANSLGIGLVGALALSAMSGRVMAGEQHGKIAQQMRDEKVTLLPAIEAAESATKGKAISAHALLSGKELEIHVRCLVGDRCMEVPVNPKTYKAGTPFAARARDKKSDPNTYARNLVSLMDQDKITLARSVEAAAKEHPQGTLTDARARQQTNQLTFMVRDFENGKTTRLLVDGKSGKVAMAPRHVEVKHASTKAKSKP